MSTLSVVAPATLWSGVTSSVWLVWTSTARKQTPEPRKFIKVYTISFVLFTAAFWQDRRQSLRRRLALQTINCSFDLSAFSNLAPPVAEAELDAATGASGKKEARRLLKLGERLIVEEERKQKMSSWWKFHSLVYNLFVFIYCHFTYCDLPNIVVQNLNYCASLI